MFLELYKNNYYIFTILHSKPEVELTNFKVRKQCHGSPHCFFKKGYFLSLDISKHFSMFKTLFLGVRFSTEKKQDALERIEKLMQMEINLVEIPETVSISEELIPEEREVIKERYNPTKRRLDEDAPGPAFHEKKEKNKKVNLGGSYKREIAKKYKKPKTRGDKNYNKRNKKRK